MRPGKGERAGWRVDGSLLLYDMARHGKVDKVHCKAFMGME